MENVKIVSSTKSMKLHYNVVTKRSVHHPHFEYRIRLADKVADFIRRNTNICRKYMIDPDEYAYYLDDENIVKYDFWRNLKIVTGSMICLLKRWKESAIWGMRITL